MNGDGGVPVLLSSVPKANIAELSLIPSLSKLHLRAKGRWERREVRRRMKEVWTENGGIIGKFVIEECVRERWKEEGNDDIKS